MTGEVLEILFGSKARSRLMRFFILNPEKEYSFSEIVQKNLLKAGDVRRELNTFKKIKFTKEKLKKNKKYYQMNLRFPFYKEMEKLIIKSGIFPQCKSLKKIKTVGNVKLVLTTGVFANNNESKLDMLLVADDVNRKKLEKIITNIEAEVGRELKYMVLDSEELVYRLNMLDRFLLNLFKEAHELHINRMPKVKQIISRLKK